MEKVKMGDTYRWGTVSVLVSRVAKDGSWADIWCSTGVFNRWSERQRLPFPDSFVKCDPADWPPVLEPQAASAGDGLRDG